MKPYQVNFHLYAESFQEVKELQDTLYDFVSCCYDDGIFVSAEKVTKALRIFKINPLVKNFLK